MISKGELDFFTSIKDNCSIIFDIGCRTDIHYTEISPNAQYHLFEPNKESFNELLKKIDIDSVNITCNNFGIGDKTGEFIYYGNTQSFIHRVRHVWSDPGSIVVYPVKKFSEYILENNILSIDFIKMDVEGFEPAILYDNIEYIAKNVKYIQFEYGSTWIEKLPIISIYDVYETYKSFFDFFYVYDENHPLCNSIDKAITIISDSALDNIEKFMREDCGINIVMIKKGLN